ncbi:MAG TPA: hypothetical protein VNA29_03170 [Sphingomicrobium sp.]|nr:hypothetical protein [Sphingomicrobium sp.]
MSARNPWLTIGGWLSALASLLHIGCIIGGPDWYRFFGAGEAMARAAERGEIYPAVVTFAIAAVLAVWAAYAFAGAGLIRRLPLLRTALVAITAVYLLRGLALVPIAFQPAAQTPFNIWSSLIVLAYGLVHLVGTIKAWPYLSSKESFA